MYNYYNTLIVFPSSSSVSTSLSIRGRSPASTCTSAMVLLASLSPKSLDFQSPRFTLAAASSDLTANPRLHFTSGFSSSSTKFSSIALLNSASSKSSMFCVAVTSAGSAFTSSSSTSSIMASDAASSSYSRRSRADDPSSSAASFLIFGLLIPVDFGLANGLMEETPPRV